MSSRTRLACGVAIGYLLGRTRKMRLALMIAGATGAAGTPRQLAERGLKQLASMPEVGKLATMARGQLVDAAKTAAMTAASSRIDALNERLQSHGDGDDEEEKKPRRTSRKERAEADDTAAEEETAEDREDSGEEGTEEDGGEPPRPRRRASTSRRRSSTDDGDDKPRRADTRRGSRAPVRRAGR